MEIRYAKALELLEKPAKLDAINLRDLFSQLYLIANGDISQTLEMLRQIAEQYGLVSKDMTFEDILDELEKMGLIKRDRGEFSSSPLSERQVRDSVFERVFKGLTKGFKGGHSTPSTGKGSEQLPSTRPFQFGDDSRNVDFARSLHNGLLRKRGQSSENISEEDLEVFETEEIANCSSVLMLDISHSMILYGEDRITPAKMVAISLVEYIRRCFPRDTIDVITFGDDAQVIPVDSIAKVAVGPYHTNTCDGLKLAQRLLRRRKNQNKQIFMITDGKPSAVYDRGRLYRNSFGLDPLVLSKTYSEAVNCRKNQIRISTFMIAQDNYLIEFVETFTKLCEGKAFYTGLGNLGEFIFVDYLENRRRRLKGL